MSTAALCLIYNHRYEGNVDRLNALYRPRFSSVRHLMPFAAQADPDRGVLPVLSGSWTFQAHLAQNAAALMDLDVEWLVFAGDDLILHPTLTQDTLTERLALDGRQAFIKGLRPVQEVSFGWYFWEHGVQPWTVTNGVEWQRLLPSEEAAAASFAAHDLPTSTRMTWRNLVPGEGMPGGGVARRALLKGARALVRHRGHIDVPYPLAMGYSDFFVVHRSVFPDFARAAGVMAAMGVFAEVAVPTALCLAAGRIATEDDVDGAGREIWTYAGQRELVAHHQGSLDDLFGTWPDDLLWLHPVKLSEWT